MGSVELGMMVPGSAISMGTHGVILGAEDARAAQRLARRLRSSSLDLSEVVVGMSSVMVESRRPLRPDEVLMSIEESSSEVHDEILSTHVIEVVLDGEDLEEVCDLLGMEVAEVARALSVPLEVATVGFSPGFGYLTGLSGPLAQLDRRPTPRPRVPPGSLAVAASLAAIYPQATPGGWWLLGRSSEILFDAQRPRPSLLLPGDHVELIVVDRIGELSDRGLNPGLKVPFGIPEVLEVMAAPPGCSLVDDGRRGHAHLGVPIGGAADPERAWILRELLGGAPAAIEVPGSGLVLRVLGAAVVAGLDLDLCVDGRQVPMGTPVSLGPGQLLEVRGTAHGRRGYLGLAGGPIVDTVLGSMGTDSLARVGPGWLQPGDRLGAARGVGPLRARASLPSDGEARRIRLVPGPHVGMLPKGLEDLAGQAATVSPTSSRVGLRLDLDEGPVVHEAIEIASMGVVTGAVQLPPDGSPIILGPDHATLGGYPVVAVVIRADLGVLGRLGPGDRIDLEMVELDEALRLEVERGELLSAAVEGSSPSL